MLTGQTSGAPRTACDVVVVGAGAVGLAAALSFARDGIATVLVGPRVAARDGRTAALVGASVETLAGLGVWPDLRDGAGLLRALTIVDDTDSLFRPPPATFEAQEIGEEALGWNVENARLVAALAARADSAPSLTWLDGSVADLRLADEVGLVLEDGREVGAALVVAADGRRSRIREAAGIGARERRHPQTAFTTILDHDGPHQDISTEFHRAGGPLTLVPLPGRRSSLVWVTGPAHARRLLAASDADLAAAIEAGTHRLLGRLWPAGPRGTVPLSTVIAERLTMPRLALIGEAAHALPPIGAQGLNLGLADVASLAAALRTGRQAGQDPGGPDALAAYERARSLDIRLRSAGVGLLNGSLLRGGLPMDAARGLGLGLLGQVGPLRRAAMRLGLPGRSGAPLAARGPSAR